MNHWIDSATNLTGETVDLIPMTEGHYSELESIAKDKRIWQHYVYDGSDSKRFRQIIDDASLQQENGRQFPFVIIYKPTNEIIGSTRFLDIDFKNKKLEIGSTWLHPDYWQTEVNPECKLLLLTFGFETLKALRIQLKTDENNIRSRKAIEKIGGVFEGIHRNDMLRDNNTHRNSAYYSIIEEEWPERKIKLQQLYYAKRNERTAAD